MKRKFALFNLALMAVVLLTTVYQSFHAFSHGHSAKHTAHNEHHHHEIKKSAKQFSAVDLDHEDEHDCSVCDFHFDFFVAPQQFFLKLDIPYYPIPYRYNSIEGFASFGGSLFALRAPPALV